MYFDMVLRVYRRAPLKDQYASKYKIQSSQTTLFFHCRWRARVNSRFNVRRVNLMRHLEYNFNFLLLGCSEATIVQTDSFWYAFNPTVR